jgi:hypothetical protein
MVIILDCCINSKKCLFNLFVKSKIKPYELKKRILNGDYGERITLDRKRRIKVRAYTKAENQTDFILA